MKNFDEIYFKWRKNFNYVALLVASITLVLELIISYLLIRYLPQTIKLSIPFYLLLYVIVPTFLNFSLVIIGRYILQCNHVSEQFKNYCSILTLSLQFLIIGCVHNIFTLTLSIHCFPIFLTLIYSDKKMTKIVTIISTIFISIRFVIAILDGNSNDTFFLIEVFVGYILMLGCYITATLLFHIEREKNECLKASSFKQLQLEELLKCDPLTGLYNMKTFYNVLDTSISNSEFPLCIAVIDIDNFKLVNDTWGHENGNEVLIYLSAQLKSCCNKHGSVFRYGGEEFTIIFPRTTAEKAKAMIERASERLYHKDFSFNPHKRITFSCGIASYTSNSSSAQDFFVAADKLMYQAKLSGKNAILIGE
jgi:diguanylate cyclase (GGDEF)-like protein